MWGNRYIASVTFNITTKYSNISASRSHCSLLGRHSLHRKFYGKKRGLEREKNSCPDWRSTCCWPRRFYSPQSVCWFSYLYLNYMKNKSLKESWYMSTKLHEASHPLNQCFWTAGPRPCTGALASTIPGGEEFCCICHFSFLSIFHEYIFYSGNILRRIILVNVSKISDPERLNNICVANVCDQDFISPVIDN